MTPRLYIDWRKAYICDKNWIMEHGWFHQYILDLSYLTLFHLKMSLKKATLKKKYKTIYYSNMAIESADFSQKSILIKSRVFESISTQSSIIDCSPNISILTIHTDNHDLIYCVITLCYLQKG